jgi:hypothetical protein
MTRIQLYFTIGFVLVVFAGAYLLTRKSEQPLGAYIDRGDQHEAAAPPAAYETKTDKQGAVTVAVKPIEIAEGAASWTFEVVLDTHSVELDDDLAAQSVLIDGQGNEYRPISWEGDPPGGHHRKGVLKFTTLSQADMIQLKIRGIGGVVERIFRWDGK